MHAIYWLRSQTDSYKLWHPNQMGHRIWSHRIITINLSLLGKNLSFFWRIILFCLKCDHWNLLSAMSTALQEWYPSSLVLEMSSIPTVLLLVNGDQLTWSPPKNLQPIVTNGIDSTKCDPGINASYVQRCCVNIIFIVNT